MIAGLTDEQHMFRDMLARLAADHCTRACVRSVVDGVRDRAWSPDLWAELSAHDILATGIAETQGGAGGGMTEQCLVAEALGAVLAPVPYVATALGARLIAAGATDARGEALLRRIAGGALRLAVVEWSGSFGTVVNGTAPFVFDGMAAEMLLLAQGDRAVLIDLDQHGVSRRSLDGVDLTRTLAEIHFENAVAEPLSPGTATHWRETAAAITAFEQLGGAARIAEATANHVKDRRVFGRSLGSYQAVKHRLADIHVKLWVARAHAGHALWALENGGSDVSLAAAGARVAANEAYRFAAREAVQLHGALGTSWEHDAHLHLRRAEALAIVWGGSAQWRERIVKQLESIDA